MNEITPAAYQERVTNGKFTVHCDTPVPQEFKADAVYPDGDYVTLESDAHKCRCILHWKCLRSIK